MVVLSLRGQRSFELLIFSLLVIIVCHTFINLGAFCLVDVKFCNCTTHNNRIVGLMVYLFFCFWFIINRQIYISTKILKSSIKRMWIVNLLYFHCGWENFFSWSLWLTCERNLTAVTFVIVMISTGFCVGRHTLSFNLAVFMEALEDNPENKISSWVSCQKYWLD
jgi:hypothetical protein